MNGDVEMADTSVNEKVAILDAGAQYGKVRSYDLIDNHFDICTVWIDELQFESLQLMISI